MATENRQTLSHIEADRLHVEQVPCRLQPILDNVLAVVRLRAADKGLHLQLICRLPLPETCHTDPVRLRQILVTLLEHAVEFTEQGEVNLTVRALAGGARLQFAVTDTGRGIPADQLADVFHPSVQVDSTLSRRDGGTGLSLASAQRLAQALGGQLEVASELGRGSTFSLTIEAAVPPGSSLPPAPPTRAGGRAASAVDEPARGLHGRVLVVDDSTDNQNVIRLLLKKRKLAVDVADDGHTACELAERSQADGHPYDLILMDIRMPQLSGLEATRRLRQQGWRGPIVALTAYVMAGEREKCLQAGCDDHLAKPLSMSEFQAILQRYLGQPPTPAEK